MPTERPALGRPLKGECKRVKFTTTVDSSLMAIARQCAIKQRRTLPSLIEELLEKEIKRFDAAQKALGEVDALASENQRSLRSKGK